MAELHRLRVFPVKGFDPLERRSSTILDGGTLRFDREFALFDANGEVFNAKATDRFHQIRTVFDPETRELEVSTPAGNETTFALEAEQEEASDWFSHIFDRELELRRNTSLGFVDRRTMGPSVVSRATLETVAGWFDELTVENVRQRLRANVEISGVPAFWEDQFVGENAPTFAIGDTTLHGVTPCGRCIVPERDPATGERHPAFRERFIQKREETFPEFADPDAFEHNYSLMLIASVPEQHHGDSIQVGDPVSISSV